MVLHEAAGSFQLSSEGCDRARQFVTSDASRLTLWMKEDLAEHVRGETEIIKFRSVFVSRCSWKCKFDLDISTLFLLPLAFRRLRNGNLRYRFPLFLILLCKTFVALSASSRLIFELGAFHVYPKWNSVNSLCYQLTRARFDITNITGQCHEKVVKSESMKPSSLIEAWNMFTASCAIWFRWNVVDACEALKNSNLWLIILPSLMRFLLDWISIWWIQ